MNDAVACALDLLKQLVCIGAPTGREHAGAAFVAQWLRDAGLGEPAMDEHANVFLWMNPPHSPPGIFEGVLASRGGCK